MSESPQPSRDNSRATNDRGDILTTRGGEPETAREAGSNAATHTGPTENAVSTGNAVPIENAETTGNTVTTENTVTTKNTVTTENTVTTLSDLTTGGTVLPIVRWGDPILHTRSQPVVSYDAELHSLITNMFATMAAADGVGLAAPQVGVDLALFVYDCPTSDGRRHMGVFCNPSVDLPTGKDRKLASAEEGCLSLPGAYIELARPDHASCTGQDAFGRDITVEGDGYFARCLQHETDHLSGIVFGDRLASRSRKKLFHAHHESAPKYPDDWPQSQKLS